MNSKHSSERTIDYQTILFGMAFNQSVFVGVFFLRVTSWNIYDLNKRVLLQISIHDCNRTYISNEKTARENSFFYNFKIICKRFLYLYSIIIQSVRYLYKIYT